VACSRADRDLKAARSSVGRPAKRAVSAACNAGSDNAGDARHHLVLKLEDIFERTVETVCPQMRASIL
jgi:hypothetical protein